MALVLSINVHAAIIVGRCIRVTDGDTITILLGNNSREQIRFYGIDSPESGQDFGNVSKKELSRLVYNKQVRVDAEGRDRYGRIIGKVYVDNIYVNREMVRLGAAWYYPRYTPNEPDLAQAQHEAKSARRGLWGQNAPLEPWEWRKLNREGGTRRVSSEAETASTSGRYWVSKSGKIHNPSCRYYGSSNSGTYTDKPEGVNCRACGGKITE